MLPPSVATASATTSITGGKRTRSVAHLLVQLVFVVGASALLGGATSFAQTFLPDALRPFANSASGWTLLTTIVVAACRARTAPSAVFGAASFVALVLGYQVVSGLRGYPTDETLFLIVGVVVGPFVGIAASWLRRAGWRAALGCGVLSGIAVGEGAYGLILVSQSTGWFYWSIISLAGLALLGVVAVRQLGSTRLRLGTIALVVTVGTAFYFAYTALGSVGA